MRRCSEPVKTDCLLRKGLQKILVSKDRLAFKKYQGSVALNNSLTTSVNSHRNKYKKFKYQLLRRKFASTKLNVLELSFKPNIAKRSFFLFFAAMPSITILAIESSCDE